VHGLSLRAFGGPEQLRLNLQSRRERHPDQFREDVQALFELLRRGQLHPAIAETVDLAGVPDVHRRIDNAEIAGKVVILCSD